MNAFAQQQLFQPVQEHTPEMSPPVCEVDMALLLALGTYLDSTAGMHKGSNRQDIRYSPDFRKKHVTVYHMIQRGVPGGFVRGVEQWANEPDYVKKLNGLLRLTPVVMIATAPITLTSSPEWRLYKISEDRIDQKIEQILSHHTLVEW